jgi:small subunit ribosomal protein S4e
MIKRHLKRLVMPNSWKFKRKGFTFITRPKPGAHPLEQGLPLSNILKDMLHEAKTTREVKKIITNKPIFVDGKRRKDHRYIIGLMDVLSIPDLKANYRMLIDTKGILFLEKIDEKEARLKLCKITGKTMVKGKMQINLFDSRNILVDAKNDYKTGDSLVIELPSQKIMAHIKFERNALLYIIKGKKVGTFGRVDNISEQEVVCKKDTGEIIKTRKEYVFVIGKDKPALKLKHEPNERN